MRWTCKQTANFAIATCIAAAALLHGCGIPRPALTDRDINPDVSPGNWQHVPAAVQAAVGPNEFAILSDDFSQAADKAVFQLLGVHGLEGEIVVKKLAAQIEISVNVKTNLRKSEIERMLTRDIKVRLEQLVERGWAPLPPSWE